jgi:hypothetical protein
MSFALMSMPSPVFTAAAVRWRSRSASWRALGVGRLLALLVVDVGRAEVRLLLGDGGVGVLELLVDARS